MAPIRILAIGSEWFAVRPGGLNRYFSEFFDALTQSPHIDVKGVSFGRAPEGGTSLGALGLPLWRRLLASASLFQEVRRTDVVNTHFALYGLLPAIYGRLLGKRVIINFQGPWADESRVAGVASWKVQMIKAFERFYLSMADDVIVLSRAFGEIAINSYGTPRHKVKVIPGAVVAPHPSVDDVAVPGVMANELVVICVRRLERRMGIDILLNAWPEVLRHVPNARLLIVGGGTAEGALKSQLAESATKRVVFAGRLDDAVLDAAYRRADLSVVPTRALEGFGLVVLESLVRGTPCVTTCVGGLPEVVEGLEPRLEVPPEDPRALADAVVEGLRGGAPSSEACVAHARRFSWERVVAEVVDLIRQPSPGVRT